MEAPFSLPHSNRAPTAVINQSPGVNTAIIDQDNSKHDF